MACTGTYLQLKWIYGTTGTVNERWRIPDNSCSKQYLFRCPVLQKVLGCLWCTTTYLAFQSWTGKAPWRKTRTKTEWDKKDAFWRFLYFNLKWKIQGNQNAIYKRSCYRENSLVSKSFWSSQKQFAHFYIQKTITIQRNPFRTICIKFLTGRETLKSKPVSHFPIIYVYPERVIL